MNSEKTKITDGTEMKIMSGIVRTYRADKSGGRKMYYSANYSSPVGDIVLASDETHIVGLWAKGQKYFGDTVSAEMTENETLPIMLQAKAWLDDYFTGRKPSIDSLPLAPIGNEFRQCVWQLLKEISYGETTTYGELAKKAAVRMKKEKMSARAVGGAVGRNPISIIIPCHRVVGANGSLTGFSGGIDMKIWLLEHEGTDMNGFFIPKRGTAI